LNSLLLLQGPLERCATDLHHLGDLGARVVATFRESLDKAKWLIDLLGKLGREDDAYQAVSLLAIEYGDDVAVEIVNDDQGDGEVPLGGAGV